MKTKLFLFICSLYLTIPAGATQDIEQEELAIEEQQFRPFTGKITGNRVRLRVQPSLEAHIVKQLKAGDLFIVSQEHGDFFATAAPKNLKAYVHRKFVLDGQIEGSRVNVRLKPTLESPVIAQLNTGDKVKGNISGEDNKWLQIDAPENTTFWVYKDYVNNIGGPEIYLRLEKKRQRIEEAFQTAVAAIRSEMQKPFTEVNIDEALNNLNQITKEEEDFPYLAEQAKTLLAETSEQFLQKKIAYLESLTENSANIWKNKSQQLQDEIKKEYAKLDRVKMTAPVKPVEVIQPEKNDFSTPEMQSWEPIEAKIYETWATNQSNYVDFESFYRDQNQKAVTLEGVLTPYHQTVKNRPGDYLLINERTNLPIAYLYSTKVNLNHYVGKKVNVRGSKRPNNNFAFPAYYILSLCEE